MIRGRSHFPTSELAICQHFSNNFSTICSLPVVGVVVDVVVVVIVVLVVIVVVIDVVDVVVVDVVVVVVLHSTVFVLVDPASLSSQVLNVQVWTYPFVNLMFAQLTPHPSFPSLDRVAV